MPTNPSGQIVALKGGAFAVRAAIARPGTHGTDARGRKLLTLEGCLSEDDATARGAEVAAVVSRLRRAGYVEQAPELASFLARGGVWRDAALDAARKLLGHEVEQAPAGLLTFRKFAERWTGGELAKEYPAYVKPKRTADDDEKRLEKHVFGVRLRDGQLFGDRAVRDVTLDDAEEVLRAPTLPAGSRRQVAQLIARLMKLAAYPSRIIQASPIPEGFLPKKNARKAMSALFPDEEAQLLACVGSPARSGVALANRVLYGFTCREGTRSSEALRMTWSDLDLERGLVRLDKNKTDDPRSWALDPGTAEALRRWFVLQGRPEGSRKVFARVERARHLAEAVRDDLRHAGIARPELFERSDSRQPFRFHDLRATFVTVGLATGRPESFVTAKTGHHSSMQVNQYRRLAQTFHDVGAGWFVDMASAIPELAALGHHPSPSPNGGPRRGRGKTRNGRQVHGELVEPPRLAESDEKSESDMQPGFALEKLYFFVATATTAASSTARTGTPCAFAAARHASNSGLRCGGPNGPSDTFTGMRP